LQGQLTALSELTSSSHVGVASDINTPLAALLDEHLLALVGRVPDAGHSPLEAATRCLHAVRQLEAVSSRPVWVAAWTTLLTKLADQLDAAPDSGPAAAHVDGSGAKPVLAQVLDLLRPPTDEPPAMSPGEASQSETPGAAAPSGGAMAFWQLRLRLCDDVAAELGVLTRLARITSRGGTLVAIHVSGAGVAACNGECVP
jgi:hypothetical protein